MNEPAQDSNNSPDEQSDDPYMVNALVRGLEVLRCFTAAQPSLSLTEIANRLGWSRTAPFRLVYTLQKLGYLQQEPYTKRYRLTSKVLELGFDYLNSLQLTEIARPYLEHLRDDTGASVHLGILEGAEVVYIDRVQTRLAVASNVHVGSRLPVHATSIGKVLLAFQPPVVIESFLAQPALPAYTENTHTALAQLRAELQDIRLKGMAISDQEYEMGIRSIAAPIRDFNGKAVAAINISGPTTVLKNTSLTSAEAEAVLSASYAISNWLGYKPD
ncbi:MAG TPA: IclR family transcriptional regulator [Chloroflexia bacterium]|nr:IclR family transcriptional regulator [Chloroflexia bacterium]